MTFLSQITTGSQNAVGPNNVMTGQSTPRATYAMVSNNTSSTWYGAVFYDAEFRRIGSMGNALSALNRSQGYTNDMDQFDTTYINQSNVFYGVNPPTQTSMDATAYTTPMGGTASMGEYGQAFANASERGVVISSIQRTQGASYAITGQAPIRNNRAFVNSDHTNQKLTLQYSGGYLTTSPLATPNCYATTSVAGYFRPQFNTAPLFSAFDGGSQATSTYGSASYNNVRKELMVATPSSSVSGRYLIAIWKNFDFDAVNGDISTLPATPTVLRMVTFPSWSDSSEARYNSKWTLVDDGSIWVSMMFEGTNTTYLYKVTRSVDDVTFTATVITSQSMTTSYGLNQGEPYGQRQMQTRDGSMTVSWMVYYYYQCGIRSWVIDKRNSSYNVGYSDSQTTMGSYPVKYKDNGFAYYRGGNVYAGNYPGAYIGGFTFKGQTVGSSPQTYTTNLILPIQTGPNTTNYPGFTHVYEYNMQSELPY